MFSVATDKSNEELAQIRKKLDLSIPAFARRLNEKQTKVHNWIYGTAKVPEKALADARKMLAEVSSPLAVAAQLLVPIPMIGNLSASCRADWTDPMSSEDWEYVPPEMADTKGRFAARIEGDSMYDLLWPDDIVVFQSQTVPKIGCVIIFRSFDGLITCKQLIHTGKDYVLHALNPSVPDEPANGTMVGYLVGIVRQQGSRRVTVYDAHGIRP